MDKVQEFVGLAPQKILVPHAQILLKSVKAVPMGSNLKE